MNPAPGNHVPSQRFTHVSHQFRSAAMGISTDTTSTICKTTCTPILFSLPKGVSLANPNIDTEILVFTTTIFAHSAILKRYSRLFRAMIEYTDQRYTINPDNLGIKYRFYSTVRENGLGKDGAGWGLGLSGCKVCLSRNCLFKLKYPC
jgi:hypothetical protein